MSDNTEKLALIERILLVLLVVGLFVAVAAIVKPFFTAILFGASLAKPWLIGFGIQMPLSLTILGVFGGFVAFGFLGLFIGPTLIAIADRKSVV